MCGKQSEIADNIPAELTAGGVPCSRIARTDVLLEPLKKKLSCAQIPQDMSQVLEPNITMCFCSEERLWSIVGWFSVAA